MIKKITGLFIAISLAWVTLPLWTQFNTGNPYYDIGSQSVHLIFIWGAWAVIRSIQKRTAKKKEQKQLEI